MEFGRLDPGRVLVLATVGLLGATASAVGTVGLLGWGLATLFGVVRAVETLTPLLLPFAAAVVLGVPLAVVGFGGVAVALVGRAVTARERLRRRAGRVAESYESELALLGLEDVVDRLDGRSPDARAEERVERLKAAYVADEIDDREFERRVEELVAEEDVDPNRVLSLRERVRETEREREYDRR